MYYLSFITENRHLEQPLQNDIGKKVQLRHFVMCIAGVARFCT